MAKHLAQIIVNGIQIVGRAFARAVQNEIRTSQQAAKARASSSNTSSTASATSSGISLQEAKQILNITDINDEEKVTESFKHLFKVNDKSIGGSFYLQSKVVRAKEKIDEEMRDLKKKEKKKQAEES